MKNYNIKFPLHFGLKYFIFLYFLSFFKSTSALSQDKILAELPGYSTQKDGETWNFINNSQYGVAGSGFIGKDQFISKCEANAIDGGPWDPIDGYKHTLCGQLYLPHQGKFEEHSDDGDIDFYIFPDPSFKWLLNNSNGNKWQKGTVLAEVSFKEPGNMIVNDGAVYLKSLPAQFCLQNIGVYGAWVRDVGHGHPEIHPIEQMWQKKDINSSKTEFYLYSMHDNEGRFTSIRHNFINRHSSHISPVCLPYLPWLKTPQIDTFYIPFEVSIIGNYINYSIDGLSGNNINPENSLDQQVRLLYKGNVLITITKTRPDFPNIFFYGLGMKDAKTIRGYLGIRTSIVRPNTDREGAHVFLKVTRITTLIQQSPSIPN